MTVFQIENTYVTTQLLKRIEKDSRVKQEIERYARIIRSIIEVGRSYQSEVIGEFFISPRGHTPFRVAWWIEGDKLFIADLLYEVETGVYVDKWNRKAGKGEINRKAYTPIPISNTLLGAYFR